MKTVAEVVKDYVETQNNSEPTFSEIAIVSKGKLFIFENVTNYKNLTNYNFIGEDVHSFDDCKTVNGFPEHFHVEISGEIIMKTKRIEE